ncbi:lytic murein transglycosylase [Antribacter gilvus]|uniref:lytic murein transglycosylase n=1 Tax=Antribacter gilvus TaxID=2304675 RepID=UPI000F769AEF|nr:lytic murein transglycosylase [Antribacter gilvus]
MLAVIGCAALSGFARAAEGGPTEPGAPGALPAAASDGRPDAGWVADTARATDVPARALEAYARADLTLAAAEPGCGLRWALLVGVGSVESGHGTYGGSAVHDDGLAHPPILGPALDGRPGFASIPASPASTAMHGDPVWDHAVGPLQFLPSTWDRWGSDGDGDGDRDPHDLDDAALAAGRYLCASGGDLTTDDGLRRALLAYNRSVEYGELVRARASAAAKAAD